MSMPETRTREIGRERIGVGMWGTTLMLFLMISCFVTVRPTGAEATSASQCTLTQNEDGTSFSVILPVVSGDDGSIKMTGTYTGLLPEPQSVCSEQCGKIMTCNAGVMIVGRGQSTAYTAGGCAPEDVKSLMECLNDCCGKLK